jgi:uracil-DNA glycosylase
MAIVHSLEALHGDIRGCRRCVRAGHLSEARPVVAGHLDAEVMLIGQAPGIRELALRAPFMGRSGRILVRWMEKVGFHSEAQFRRWVYLTSVTKCYPGRLPGAGGDRRPSRAEIELCRPHLERQLALIDPWLIMLVGGLAIERYLPARPLESLIGRAFDITGGVLAATATPSMGPVLVPLPHPSGASRWMNDPTHRALVDRALRLLRVRLRDYVATHND